MIRFRWRLGLLTGLMVLNLCSLQAQLSIKDSVIALGMLQISYRGMMPGGDLADRFGYSSQLGVDLGWKFDNNFYIGIGGHVWFSEAIRDTQLLQNLTTGGLLIGNVGLLTDVRMIGTGYIIPLTAGKQFSLPIFPNPNTGFYAEVGGQFFQHKIKMTPTDESVPAIEGEYAKGYDRLVFGFGVKEEIGFRYLSNNGMVNLSIGLEFSQNFTKGRRSLHFDTGQAGNENRLDLLGGFHISWIYPLYERAPQEFYYR